jgi:hypothetical protein
MDTMPSLSIKDIALERSLRGRELLSRNPITLKIIQFNIKFMSYSDVFLVGEQKELNFSQLFLKF